MSNHRSQIQISNLKSKLKGFAILVLVLTFGFCVLSLDETFAQSKVLINEFLIDPQPQQVELYNSGTETIDISGWIIDDSGGTTYYAIPQSSILNPGFCLVFSGDFNLNKSSADIIRLLNNSQIVDSFSYKSSSGSGISYMRLPDGENSWTTGSANLGKYNSRTEQACLFPTLIPTEIPTPIETGRINPSPTETPLLNPISYDNIYISEAMVNPESGQNEWIEIYNNNDFPISLTNWYFDDLENSGSSPKTFSLEIPAKAYKVFSLTSSIFNNDGDNVRLLDWNKNLKDSFEYNLSTQGKTYGIISTDNDNFCLMEPSFESVNNLCISPSHSPTPTQIQAKTPIPTKTSIAINKPTAKPRSIIQPTGSYQGEVLGVTTQKPNKFLLVRLSSFISFSYSLLTIVAVLFKMKIIYAKLEEFFSSFIYSERRK